MKALVADLRLRRSGERYFLARFFAFAFFLAGSLGRVFPKEPW